MMEFAKCHLTKLAHIGFPHPKSASSMDNLQQLLQMYTSTSWLFMSPPSASKVPDKAAAAIPPRHLILHYFLWLRPRKLEWVLHLQGLSGNPYRFLFGDLRENSILSKEAKWRPISHSDDPKPRLLSFVHRSVNNFGKDSFMWIGPTPRVTSPQLWKDVFLRMDKFQRASIPPLVKLLAHGLASLEGNKWARHRKIINPAFHVEKLTFSSWTLPSARKTASSDCY